MDSLHWFQSVSEKCNQEKQILAQQKVNASRDDKTLQHTLSLTTKRLELFQQVNYLYIFNKIYEVVIIKHFYIFRNLSYFIIASAVQEYSFNDKNRKNAHHKNKCLNIIIIVTLYIYKICI